LISLIAALLISKGPTGAGIAREPVPKMSLSFTSQDSRLQSAFDRAIEGLKKNVRKMHGYDRPVLIEGAEYPGIWLECGPLEAAVYGVIDPEVAIDSHRIFFAQQREDGYLPCWIWFKQSGTGQIQMVVPIAATAFEVYQQVRDEEFLKQAYTACSRWDAWLVRYRNTRGTGLCEAFCEFDTGHDNSPRWAGLPHECPGADARVCAPVGGLPYVAPDLSATLYGGRVALAKMASQLGRKDEAREWTAKAEATRRALLALCFDPETSSFYDLDKDDKFVRIRGDAITRVVGEHVVDQPLFERIYARQIRNEKAFWTPYPLPSIAADDPKFVKPIPRNSWGGASQALTALRAPRWFEHYGKWSDLTTMMERWVEAIARADGFYQQMDPWTGEFTPAGANYSPAMLVLLDYVTRLRGVRFLEKEIEWNCLLPGQAASDFKLGKALLRHDGRKAELQLGGKTVATVEGPCRVVTDTSGKLLRIVGASPKTATVNVTNAGANPMQLMVESDAVKDLRWLSYKRVGQ